MACSCFDRDLGALHQVVLAKAKEVELLPVKGKVMRVAGGAAGCSCRDDDE